MPTSRIFDVIFGSTKISDSRHVKGDSHPVTRRHCAPGYPAGSGLLLPKRVKLALPPPQAVGVAGKRALQHLGWVQKLPLAS